jgi:hypothetical protein
MPIRSTRPRKNDGLRKHIIPLFERPALRFLSGEEYEPVAQLIFGPCTSRPDRELLERLKPLWAEIRDDILAAQQQYQPGKKPWGARFDKRGEKQ